MPANPDVQAVVFDLDGLMFNTEDLYDEAIEQLLLQRGHRFSTELKLGMMGLPGLQAIAVLGEHCRLDESRQSLLNELHQRMTEILPGRLTRLPGLTELLDRLERRGLPRSIATSSSRAFANRCLELSDLAGHFAFVLTAEDVPRGKPAPDIYLESAARHGIAPRCMLVLEDSLTGSRAAAAAGAFAVAVPGHHSRDQDFSHVNLVIDSLAARELTEILEPA